LRSIRAPALALDVLLGCAARDYPHALDATRDYIADGRYWSQAVVALVDDRSTTEPRSDWRERVQGVPGVLKSRWPSFDSLVQAFRDDWDFDARRTPWREWADEDPELAAALREARPPRQPQPSARERIRGLATEDLLALAGSGNLRDFAQILVKRTTQRDVAAIRAVASDPSVPMHAAAVSALAAKQDVDVLPAILALTEETRPRAVHALLFRALGALPYEATRGTVLEWLQGNDSSRRAAAASAMAKHVITDDVPLLRELLGVELDAGAKGEQYLVCSYAEGLGRQPALGPYPELDRAFIEMPYSYGRRFVVDALVATDPTFPAVRAVHCLWDAEPAIRATAAKVVDVRNQEAASRLQVLTADPAEEPDVRCAADRVNR
jgi:hypothetical protein